MTTRKTIPSNSTPKDVSGYLFAGWRVPVLAYSGCKKCLPPHLLAPNNQTKQRRPVPPISLGYVADLSPVEDFTPFTLASTWFSSAVSWKGNCWTFLKYPTAMGPIWSPDSTNEGFCATGTSPRTCYNWLCLGSTRSQDKYSAIVLAIQCSWYCTGKTNGKAKHEAREEHPCGEFHCLVDLMFVYLRISDLSIRSRLQWRNAPRTQGIYGNL